MTQMKKCDKCKGTGIVTTVMTRRGVAVEEADECSVCDGSGWVATS